MVIKDDVSIDGTTDIITKYKNERIQNNELDIEIITQWHPAFCSAIELELREDKKILNYEREHNLGKMPLRIDLLVIKKKPDETIKNEIGDFFKGNNIMEYKSPDDEVNIDTFYKVLSYACLYKAETGNVDEIQDTDITISLIREGKPVKLLRQLGEKYSVNQRSPGIYRVDKMLFPLQIIVTRELDPGSHIWLKALTRSLKREEAGNLMGTFESLQDEEDRTNARAVIDLVTGVNEELFQQIIKEGESMSEALKKLIAPELMMLIAQKDAEIKDREAEIADRKAEIADRDAEIMRLKKELMEAKLASTK